MPFCTMLLADMGSRVIKIESRKQGRDRVSAGLKRELNGVVERVPAAQYRERNKLAITLNLKSAKGVELFNALVKHADVGTENFSVGTMERLGIGYETLSAKNPGLVCALDNLGERYNVSGEIPTRVGNVSFTGSSSGVYRTTDGYVAIASGTSELIWQRFCQITARPDLLDDPQFATAAARRDCRGHNIALVRTS